MIQFAYRNPALVRWIDQIELAYWRTLLRLTRRLRRLQAEVEPVRHLMWLPAAALPLGVLIGVALRQLL